MHKQHPVWYGVGFAIVPLFVLVIGYLNIHPEFYRNIPRDFELGNTARFVSIGWKDDDKDDPPLEYVSDGFKGVRISTQTVEVASFWDLWNTPSSQVEYEWRYKVKNLTDTKLRISVTYKLVDKNSQVVASSDASKLAEPGETIEFEELGHLDYRDAQRVTDSSWSIGNRVVP